MVETSLGIPAIVTSCSSSETDRWVTRDHVSRTAYSFSVKKTVTRRFPRGLNSRFSHSTSLLTKVVPRHAHVILQKGAKFRLIAQFARGHSSEFLTFPYFSHTNLVLPNWGFVRKNPINVAYDPVHVLIG